LSLGIHLALSIADQRQHTTPFPSLGTAIMPPKAKRSEGSKRSEDEVDPKDPSTVTGPVQKHVHPKMKQAWRVHPKHEMCYIFDFVTPSRKWKRGSKYTESGDFAEPGRGPWYDLTESDEDGELNPVAPAEIK
jgi:hypothetical protein